MIPAAHATVIEVDSCGVDGDSVIIFLTLATGATHAIALPLAELLERGHTVVEAADAAALRRPGAALNAYA